MVSPRERPHGDPTDERVIAPPTSTSTNDPGILGFGHETPQPVDNLVTSAFDDGMIAWRKLAFRGQESLLRWEFDPSGGMQTFIQRVQGSPEIKIPVERCLLFRTTTAKGNPEGRSLLRPAWRAWRNKKYVEDNEGTGIQSCSRGR
jgi:hypothetical protein